MQDTFMKSINIIGQDMCLSFCILFVSVIFFVFCRFLKRLIFSVTAKQGVKLCLSNQKASGFPSRHVCRYDVVKVC